MATIKINGVGYNIEIMQTLTKEQFMALPVHAVNLKKIVKEKRQAVLNETWEILSSKFKKDGNVNGNGATDKATEPTSLPAGRTNDTGNERTVSKPKRNSTGNGYASGQGEDNP